MLYVRDYSSMFRIEKRRKKKSSSSLGHVIAMHLIHDAQTFFDFILCICARRRWTVSVCVCVWSRGAGARV